MIEGFHFINQEHWLGIGLIGFVIFLGFIFKEWKDRERGWFMPNAFVVFITLVALALIALAPTREIEISDRKAILLTDSFELEQKDSLQKLYKGIKVISYDPKKSMRKALDSLTGIYVLGNGIKPFDFWQFKDIPVAYIPTKASQGITRLRYSREISIGEPLEIHGVYHEPVKGNFLIVQDPAGNGLDSIQFSGNKKEQFILRSVPKVSGRFVYALAEKDSTGIELNAEPLPMVIHQKHGLRVLVLNNFPMFETKYLKNFLAENGHEVLVRSQLTTGKFKFEYFNTQVAPLYQITDAVLKEFDVVIVDSDTYLNFGKGTKTVLERNIREQGLGLFIQPNDRFFSQADGSYFTFPRDGINIHQMAGSKTLLDKYPYRFEEGFSVQPVLSNDTQQVAAYRPLGKGRVASTVVQNTYQLVLEGEERAYSYLWTSILDKLAKTKTTAVHWKGSTNFPRIDAPFEFELRTNLAAFQVRDTATILTGMKQDYLVPSLYTGKKYPRDAGWNTLHLENDSTTTFSYYVFDEADWNALESAETRNINRTAFSSDVKAGRTIVVNQTISPLYFYSVFVLGIGWLWLVPKVFG